MRVSICLFRRDHIPVSMTTRHAFFLVHLCVRALCCEGRREYLTTGYSVIASVSFDVRCLPLRYRTSLC